MKHSYERVDSSTRTVLLLLAVSVFLASCATTPWYLRASEHFGQTYRTRALDTENDVFFGPNFNLYPTSDLESIWVGLQKEANKPYIQLGVQTILRDRDGTPFQRAKASAQSLDFLNVSLSTYDEIKQNLTVVNMTVQRFIIQFPLSFACTVACDSEDFVVELSGDEIENFDLVLPRAMLLGFLGKVKKSGEEGIEGECFDQFL